MLYTLSTLSAVPRNLYSITTHNRPNNQAFAPCWASATEGAVPGPRACYGLPVLTSLPQYLGMTVRPPRWVLEYRQTGILTATDRGDITACITPATHLVELNGWKSRAHTRSPSWKVRGLTAFSCCILTDASKESGCKLYNSDFRRRRRGISAGEGAVAEWGVNL
ncbi:hypothetical protein M514_12381 [Trichuris suis]|uniref:Uncharacterized protein n=1 Tax=Trichuris suis TaxID=68888 RepID=A0A085MTW6_9BILA|nr:hypothetical protein M513_12381 [Trichuris suis]KFD60662.1 hypothetical protein M514_12381 [Trichuris suis]